MTRLVRIRSLTLVLTLCTLFAATVHAEESVTVPLASASDRPLEGVVLVRTQGEVTSLSVEMVGLEPGTAYAARLQAGSCNSTSASSGHLGTVTADAEGRGTLSTSDVRMAAAGAFLGLTRDLVTHGDHVITIHGEHRIACASIPFVSDADLPVQP